ncbi:MAG: TonB family protein [Gammaproteobacteria bacterium]
MVPGSAPGGSSREADLTTSSAEQRTRTFDVVPGSRSGLPGTVAGPAPGDVLKNRFVLHQCLAGGSTSRLFRALDQRREAAGDPDPWVVLKVVTAPPSAGTGEREPRPLQALRREAAIAQGLDHPNLPRVLGLDHDGPHTFVCMGWLEGESLAAILDSRGSRPMTRVQALHIVDGVGRALAHVHAQGITHADVKPGNILVTAQGDATLLDFGVALGPGAGDLPSLRGYTPEYASPEVLAGDEPTPSDDLFSLACVAYRMLGGHRAFGTANAREAAAAGARPPRPAHLSPAQWRALDRALAFARADRQPDVETFLAQLRSVRDETAAITDLPPAEPVVQTPAPAAFGTGFRRPPLPRGLTAALLVLGVAGFVGAGFLVLRPDTTALPAPEAGRSVAPTGTAPAPEKVVAPADSRATELQVQSRPALPQPDSATAITPAPATPAPAAVRQARKPSTPAPSGVAPVELAGPPVPEPGDPAQSPAPGPAASPAGGLADTANLVPAVPYSSLTLRRYVEPDYPRNAASRRVAGWVDVAFLVEPSGRTRDARVVGAEPPGLFEDAALAAVRRWRFASAGGGATAGSVSSQIRVRFEPD